MKTIEDFKYYYQTVITSQVESLNSQRVGARNVKNLGIVLTIGFNILLPELLSLVGDDTGLRFWFPLSMASILAYFIITYRVKNAYADAYKTTIGQGMLDFIFPGLQLDPDDGMMQQAFVLSGIYYDDIGFYGSSDMVTGYVGQTHVKFSNVSATRSGRGLYMRMFRGLFFAADFNKDFNGEIYVVSRTHGLALGERIGQWMENDTPQVQMEDPRFNERFRVYATDPVECRYILSPALMEKMEMLDDQTNGLSFSFVRSYIFIALPTSEKIFAPDINRHHDFTTYLNWFACVSFMVNVVEELNLNQRIYGS